MTGKIRVHLRASAAAPKAPLLLVMLALAGCAPRDTDTRTTIRFWALGREGEVVQELVTDFEKEHPNIRVRVQQIPWTAAHEKMLTAFVGEATPDIAQLGNTWVPEFATLDAIEPMDPYLARSTAVTAATFFPGVLKTNVVNGVLYGVPWYVDTRVIFYRTDILAEAGYAAPPTTWGEWRRAMEKIKTNVGPKRYAIYLPTNEWEQATMLGLQAGSPLLRDGGRYGAFSDSAFRRGFEFYVSIFRDGLAPSTGTLQIGNLYEEFARGLFAMYITGPWNIGEFTSRLPDSLQTKWATAPLPGPDSSGVSFAGGSSLVIFRGSEHKAEAWALVEYLSRPEQQKRFYRLTGDLPPSPEAWTDSALAGNRHARAFYEQLGRITPLPPVPEWELIASKVRDYADAAARGAYPVDEALRRLDGEVNVILEKRRWMLGRASARGN